MRTERKTFRPFDVPGPLESFLDEARLRIGDSPEIIEPGARRRVDPPELRTRDFTLELTEDDASFGEAINAAVEAATVYGEDALEFVVVVSSAYLKLWDIVVRTPLGDLERTFRLRDSEARGFDAVHHGCDVEASLVLKEEIEQELLRPWRKGTWLSRATFGLRTGLDGLGFTILPLTDEKRTELSLPSKTLRYAVIEESPLEAASVATVTLYVDAELLAHLNKTPRKPWARAFTDQLAVDVLTAVAMRAVADPNIQDASWDAVEDKLMGSLLMMVGGRPNGRTKEHYEALLDMLRSNPLDFLTRIEGALEMRDSGKLIVRAGN